MSGEGYVIIMLITYLTHILCISHTRRMKYQPIFHTLHFTLHHARVLNNVFLTAVIKMVEILVGRICIALS